MGHKNWIENSEISSWPIFDATKGQAGRLEAVQERGKALPVELTKKLRQQCEKEGCELEELFLVAASIVLEKYSGSSASLFALLHREWTQLFYEDIKARNTLEECLLHVREQLNEEEQSFRAYELSMLPYVTMDPEQYASFSFTGEAEVEGVLLLGIWQTSSGIELHVKYRAEHYHETTMQRFLASLAVILWQLAEGRERPAEYTMLDEEMEAQLESFCQTEKLYDASVSVVDLFEQSVTSYPERTAIVYKDKRITYAELNERANAIAAYLNSQGIGREDVVSILIPRCEYMGIASLGVLKSGAAYQPLDATYPPERLLFMIEDAGAKLLIAERELIHLIPDYQGKVLYLDEIEMLKSGEPIVQPAPENLFIMLYTSGSTGMPKGVQLEHRNLVAFCHWFQKKFQVDETARTAAYASYGFDADMMDLYPTLLAGGEVHIIEEEIRLDLLAIQKYFTEHQITHSFMTTQVGRQYADLFPNADYPHYLMTGGEALVPVEPPSGYAFYNLYGPTETTVSITSQLVEEKYARVPIGVSNENTKLYIVDDAGNRLPVGVPGELWVSGAQVSRGYLNRPEQMAKVFMENPFCKQKGYERIYRTGDIVRFLEDGSLDFIGREDGQVKIRGFRIELSEVEEIIRSFEGIQDATVQAFKEQGGGKYIAAYIVSDQAIDIQALNRFIAQEKPPYMVPAVTMQIDSIPLNQNQKVNKKALPMPVREVHTITPPENERQKEILNCLKEVVGYEEIGIEDNLFEAGLTSIGAIKFVVLLYDRLDVTVSTKLLHSYDTVKKLDAYLPEHTESVVREKREKYPLTQTQKGIYVECMMNPSSVLYNLPCRLKVSKRLSSEALSDALRQTVNRHPSMKCCIRMEEDGEIYQYPQEDKEVFVEHVEGSEAEFLEYFRTFARPFDFTNGPLYRLSVYQTEEANYVVFDFHHIISDGTSIANFLEQMNRILLGKEVPIEAYTQFDLAIEEEKRMTSKEHQEAKEYYKALLEGISGCTEPEHDLHQKEESCGFYKHLDSELDYDRVQAFCEKNKITQNVFFLAVMGFVLGKYAYTEDVCFTTIYHGRNDVRMSDMMGMLVKTLPIRCNTDPQNTAKEYVTQVRDQLLANMDHDLYSFAEISHAFQLRADVLFAYQGDDFVEFELGGEKTVLVEGRSDKAKAELSIDIFVEQKQYRLEFEYRSDYYSEVFIRRMCGMLLQTAKSFLEAQRLSDVDITSQEEGALIESFNQTEVSIPIVSVNRLFEEYAAKIPEQLAVVTRTEQLTYSELNRCANRVAHALIRRGITENTVIGLILNRSPYVYMAEQGVLKAGGAFLPMVPDYPDDRLDYCLLDSETPYVITTKQIQEERKALFQGKTYQVLTMEELLREEQEENPSLLIHPDSLAYCIYTSGSTGTPKGVMVAHRNLCNFVTADPMNCEVEEIVKNGTVMLAMAPITFDVSIEEHFVALSNGMTICMADEDEIYNPIQMAELILKRHADVLVCTPSFVTNIIDMEQMHPALRKIRVFDIGAEAFPASLYEKIRKINPIAYIINSYGPTECTVCCAAKVLKGQEKITIGGPLTNMKLYVVDKSGHILPVGINGELIICGAGVGRGYVNLPEKTKAAFFTFRGRNAYHSGDLVRWTENGEIDFQGRIDNQVKLRGLRVELDEVENAINSFGGILTSKVVVQSNGSEEYLAGYFTAQYEIQLPALIEHLKSKLTYYMVPGVFMQLNAMPLTANGKIDKKKLPRIEAVKEENAYIEPKDEIEKAFCEKFGELLGLQRVSADANFFEIGGTSLSAAKIAMFAMNMGYQLVYKDIFANPTPQSLAEFLQKETKETGNALPISGYDYGRIDEYMQAQTSEKLSGVRKGRLQNIILTGATGFLGIHVLKQFLVQETGTAYCMVRKGRYDSCEHRLMAMLVYYFDNAYEEEFQKGRIVCFDGDITDAERVMELSGVQADTVINCAACVKHFVKDDLLDRINVQGVKNLIAVCEKSGKRLIQISTTSVAGEGSEKTVGMQKIMYERELYFGQIIDNDYIRTKFLAEREILEHTAKGGLDARIVRVGNLMSRRSDGEFQINFKTNGFMRAMNAYKVLKQFPMEQLHQPVEFSPIDATAASILELAAAECEFSVFHSYNNHTVFMADVICAMKEYGFELEIVPEEEFEKTVKLAAQREDLSNAVLGLIAYNSDDEQPRYEVPADNALTMEVLYRLGFKWPIIDDEYLKKAIRSLDTLGFFEA